VVPNIIDDGFFKVPLQSRDRVSMIFCCIANLIQLKRHDILLRAFAEHVHRFPSSCLRIVGDGPLRRKLSTLAAKLEIASKVEFLGQLPPGEVIDTLAACDALVLASDHETFGVVLVEAWALGLPTLTTASGGPDHMVQAINGKLVPCGVVSSLAEGMDEFARNRPAFDREAIRRFAIENFGESFVIQRQLMVYERAIAHHLESSGKTGSSSNAKDST
jgi:glycosyltransferase involved in cell wall biosynthesis